jgi:dipeptidyl-peptidase-4
MPRHAAAWVGLLVFVTSAPAQTPVLRTTAEKTNYQETTRHADVLAFCEALAKQSPLVRHTTFATSHEDRPLPLLILSDPPVATPEEAEKTRKPVVLAYANIHAGEVDGKEALLALARDLTADNGDPILKKLVVLIAPNVNPDGNERIDPKNRQSQNGPPNVGTRTNAQGLDLNRDFIKLESPEVRGIVKLLNRWDPLLVIDCHTTNGSYHRYALTYDGPRYPAADPRIIEYARDKLLPAIEKKVKETSGFDTFVYGNFSRDRQRWETYPSTPRFGTQYVALRNRIGLLSESYSYAPFADRVKASYHFVKAAFDYAAANRDELKKLTAEADKPRPRVALRAKLGPADQDAVIKGYEGNAKTGPEKDYPVKVVTKAEPTLEIELPSAYFISPTEDATIDVLRRHGIKVEELREDIEVPLETYMVGTIQREKSPFQRHNLVTLEVAGAKTTRTIPAGTLVVRTAQPLGSLAAYLLEPQAEDGLAAWNFFDSVLGEGKEYPVQRLVQAVPLHTGSPRPLPEDRSQNKPITFEFLSRGGNFGGNPASGFEWLPDGEHFYQSKEGKLWKIHALTGRAELAYDETLLRKSRRAIDRGERAEDEPGEQPRLRGRLNIGSPRPAGFGQTDPNRTGMLFNMGQDLGFAYFDGRPAIRLTKSGGKKEFVTFSPDGSHIAFVRDGNLFTVDLATQTERKLTTDGGGDILNGRADWVYEEEIFHRNGRAYWWCPDEPRIVFMRFDDKPVHKFPIVGAFPTRATLENIPYPKAGDPNPLVKIGIVAPGDDQPRFLDLGEYKPEKIVIARVGWVPERKTIFAYIQNREQTWLDFVVWDAPESAPRKLFRETTQAWVEDLGEPHWLADGSFLIASERSGWKHLYHYSSNGTLIRPVTEGAWEVRAVHRVDEDGGCVYLSGTKDGHTRQNLYRANLDGSGIERLTDPEASHQVTVAPTGGLFIDRATDNDTPIRVFLRDMEGNVIRRLDTNPVYEREGYIFGPFERVTIPMSDGFVLEGSIVKPPDFDPTKKYPIWIETYAGPHAPTVRDGWGTGRVYEQVLAQMGIVVFRVDPRSASGKGAQAAWTAYRQLGVQELKDLEEAVDWICQNSWADATRIGLSGHSYGGFMTAFALTHSTKFAAGISGAPVTDWRLYDTIYTERYMGLPSENKEGYDATSCVKAADKLHGRLLLIHGLIDDNVHFQNTAQFVDALQRAGKDFEMMVYPRSRHGIGGQHYQKLRIDFIKRTMLP